MADGSTLSLLVPSSSNAANLIYSMFKNDRTFNSIKAGRCIIISLPFDGPQNHLTVDIATTLPVNTLTGIGTYLQLKSNYTQFMDGADNAITEVTPSYVAILRDLDFANKTLPVLLIFKQGVHRYNRCNV